MKKHKKEKMKVAAIFTLNSPEQYNDRGRKQIAEWLRRQARDLIKLGDQYGPKRFTARYFY